MTEPVWELLNDLEDIIHTGYRVPHRATPVPQTRIEPESAEHSQHSQDSRDCRGPQETAAGTKRFDSFDDSLGLSSDGTTLIPQLGEIIQTCTDCSLARERLNAVPGTGSAHPLLMIVSEAPCADDDRVGLPFVGPAGQYLDRWLKAVGLSRHRNVYITTLVKCRPPQNRGPASEEVRACLAYLQQQVKILQPAMFLLLGRSPANVLLQNNLDLEHMRGNIYTCMGLPALVSYHPGKVLRDQRLRPLVWDDLKRMREHLRSLRSDYRPPDK